MLFAKKHTFCLKIVITSKIQLLIKFRTDFFFFSAVKRNILTQRWMKNKVLQRSILILNLMSKLISNLYFIFDDLFTAINYLAI